MKCIDCEFNYNGECKGLICPYPERHISPMYSECRRNNCPNFDVIKKNCSLPSCIEDVNLMG